jgi:ABC-2 type transport system ATP-binding protein
MSLAIETFELTRSFDEFVAVDRVHLNVQAGSTYGFLGPNGAGKSTTIKMLTGILAPSSGRIEVLGLDPWNPRQAIELKRRVGVVPEGLALFDHLNATEYLTFVGRMYLLPKETIRQRIEQLLHALDLEQAGKKLTLEFSHGMKKKLAFAGALLPNPDLLFLDEPFEGVDAISSRAMRGLLGNFTARGSTVFVTSHVLEIVQRICTHVGIIAQGKLVEQTSLAELQQDRTLEQRFLELVGTPDAPAQQLHWLKESSPAPTGSDDPPQPRASP